MTDAPDRDDDRVNTPRTTKWSRSALALLWAPAVIYGAYWMHLGSFVPRSPGDHPAVRPFYKLGKALLQQRPGEQGRFVVVPYAIAGPDTCSFWTFEAVLKRCRGVGVLVKSWNEDQRGEVVAEIDRLATQLAEPCKHLHMLGGDASEEGASLGCGREVSTFVLRVQGFSSTLHSLPSGGGKYVQTLIHTRRLDGVVQ